MKRIAARLAREKAWDQVRLLKLHCVIFVLFNPSYRFHTPDPGSIHWRSTCSFPAVCLQRGDILPVTWQLQESRCHGPCDGHLHVHELQGDQILSCN